LPPRSYITLSSLTPAPTLEKWKGLRAVSAKDVQPPLIVNCPNNLTVYLEPQQDYAVVTWTEPEATDNVAIEFFTGSYEPGFNCSILQSPLIVSYLAIDSSGNFATCDFEVTVEKDDWITYIWPTLDVVAIEKSGGFEISGIFTVDRIALNTSNVRGLTPPPSVNLAAVTRHVFHLAPPEGMQFLISSQAALQTYELDVTLNYVASEPFDIVSSFARIELDDLRHMDDTPVTLQPHWSKPSPATTISGSQLRAAVSGAGDTWPREALVFTGITVEVLGPRGATVPPATSVTAANVSLDRLVFQVRRPGLVEDSALALVPLDLTPPVIICREDIFISLNETDARQTVTIPADALLPVSVTDESGNATLVDAPSGMQSFIVGKKVTLVFTAVDEWGNTASCDLAVDVTRLSTSTGGGDNTTADNNGTIVVVGASLGAALILVALVVALVVIRRRRAKPYNFEDRLRELAEHLKDKNGLVRPREIRRDAVKLLTQLGAGNWGEVHKGLLGEHRDANIPAYLVAIKTLKSSAADAVDDLMREACFMAQLNCDHIVRLYGVATVGEPFMMVMEYCEHGSLQAHLRNHEVLEGHRIKLAHDTAQGLKYLAARNIVHRDIAARNILLNSEMRGKIADFGMSRESAADSAYYTSRGGAVPVRWSAPEALDDHKFSEKSDVWSYGVLLYELYTRAELPYKGLSNQRVWVDVVSGERLPKPQACPEHVYQMMLQCWAAFPRDRPSFATLTDTMVLWLGDGDTNAVSATTEYGGPQTAPRRANSYLEPVQLAAELSSASSFRKNTNWGRSDERSGLGSSTCSHASVRPNVYQEGAASPVTVPLAHACEGPLQKGGMLSMLPSATVSSLPASPVAGTPSQTSVELSLYSDLIGGNGRVITPAMTNADVMEQGQQAACRAAGKTPTGSSRSAGEIAERSGRCEWSRVDLCTAHELLFPLYSDSMTSVASAGSPLLLASGPKTANDMGHPSPAPPQSSGSSVVLLSAARPTLEPVQAAHGETEPADAAAGYIDMDDLRLRRKVEHKKRRIFRGGEASDV
jgi:serine/threonine protein kinase